MRADDWAQLPQRPVRESALDEAVSLESLFHPIEQSSGHVGELLNRPLGRRGVERAPKADVVTLGAVEIRNGPSRALSPSRARRR